MPEASAPHGALAEPGEPGYADATAVFNLAVKVRPRAAVVARTVDEIRSALETARSRGLRVRTLGTGHAAGSVRPLDDGLLVRPRLKGTVEVDAARRVARVPAGTTWGEVVQATAPYGLTAAHGSSGSVGVVGYLLGGGVSFYGRLVGLASNTLRAAELVTADGELLRADTELLWALRGGGGGFGVVTAVELDLLPVHRVLTGGSYWPIDDAFELLETWLEWTRHAPRRATTSWRVMNLPDLPGVPPVLAGRMVVTLDGAVTAATPRDLEAARGDLDDLLGPLYALGTPLMDTWQETGPAGVLEAHMDPPFPVPFIGDHLVLRDPGPEGCRSFLDAVGEGSGSPLAVATLRQLGGAFAEPGQVSAALASVDGHLAYMGSGPPVGPVTAEDLIGHRSVVRRALGAWDTGRTIPSLVEAYGSPQRHLDERTALAVAGIRGRLDPEGLFGHDVGAGALA
ncbi:FAD-dependent oxidoreductase [Streptomyces sp. ST2-7A]|uniref:FAD-binding oxidoreductase n=1 Tax=Streptomyces sp. ST2-7A TaxID=2907214 RepID=UPI001F256759|nr:FAD-dependent oxidoreductase [Streptomyces sp. ST2-7A]MCE7079483.1 FAD-dependent oxidoreductase [Streptomyces sp. ST2-7A]